jgi:hypothetical protein
MKPVGDSELSSEPEYDFDQAGMELFSGRLPPEHRDRPEEDT